MAGQQFGIGRLQHAIGQRQQVRMMFGERAAGTGRGGERTDGQPPVRIRGVPEQQAQDLAARVSTGTGDGY
jgi:hypothetical protein